MSLEKIGSVSTISAIKKRIAAIQKWNAEHPEEAAKRDAEIDADRAKMRQVITGATHAHTPKKDEPVDKFSRKAMRLKPPEDD